MKRLMLGAALLLLVGACKKSEDSSADSSSPESSGGSTSQPRIIEGEEPKKPVQDFSKPWLNEKRMKGMIESLKEKGNPFEIFASGSVFNPGGRLNEFNAFARKHGFADAEEYVGAWGRTFGTWMLMSQEDAKVAAAKGYDIQIETLEKELKKPDLAPETRKAYEESLKQVKDAKAESLKPSEETCTKEDMDVMRKHSAEFVAAMNGVKK